MPAAPCEKPVMSTPPSVGQARGPAALARAGRLLTTTFQEPDWAALTTPDTPTLPVTLHGAPPCWAVTDVTGFATVTSVTGFVSVTVVTVTGSEEAAVTDTVFVTFTSEVPMLIIGMA